jgi:hypothetical protein
MKLTVAFLYSLPLIVLKSSASAIDADSAVKIASVALPVFHAADCTPFARTRAPALRVLLPSLVYRMSLLDCCYILTIPARFTGSC